MKEKRRRKLTSYTRPLGYEQKYTKRGEMIGYSQVYVIQN